MRRMEECIPSLEPTESERTALLQADSPDGAADTAKIVSVEADMFSSRILETPVSVPQHTKLWKQTLARRLYWTSFVLCLGFVLGLGCAFLLPVSYTHLTL